MLRGFIEEIKEAEARVGGLDGHMKAASVPGDEDDEEMEDEGALSEAEIKVLKSELRGEKKKLKGIRQSFVERLKEAQGSLSSEDAKITVLEILKGGLVRELESGVTAHRQEVVCTFEGWWEKYRVTLRRIESTRDGANSSLNGFLRELGYDH